MAPLQDTPSIKITYGACVTVENTYTVLMSANVTTKIAIDGTYNMTCFHMPIPIPDYLIAIAIGNIAYTDLGGRAGIYTEPEMMQSAV